jgi:hypothetical protein
MDLDIPEAGSENPINWPDPSSKPMPEYFRDKLKNICKDCKCKGDILWRNLYRAEPHFDACFRYFDGKPVEPATSTETRSHHRCFLKRESIFENFVKLLTTVVYTLRVPFLACQPVALSLVHHVRVEGKKFVPARRGNINQEHIFGFIAGFTSPDLGRILTDLFTRWQDITADRKANPAPRILVHFLNYNAHPKLLNKNTTQFALNGTADFMISDLVKATAGMTPRLFMATVLSQYGWVVAQEVIKSGRTLVYCDKKLQAALTKLRDAEPGSSDDVTAEIGQMNETLIKMNINLTGTRSTMHYLAESAHTLISGVSTFERYIQARLSEWEDNSDAITLMKALHELDSCKESIRDNDKLELVRKTMGQYKIDIKSLQQHIDISVGMVSHSLLIFMPSSTDIRISGTQSNR